MGWTASNNEQQQTDQAEHTMATLEREQIHRMTMQKVAGWHSNEGGNYLDQDSIGHTAVECIAGRHPAVDGQCPSDDWWVKNPFIEQAIIYTHLDGFLDVLIGMFWMTCQKWVAWGMVVVSSTKLCHSMLQADQKRSAPQHEIIILFLVHHWVILNSPVRHVGTHLDMSLYFVYEQTLTHFNLCLRERMFKVMKSTSVRDEDFNRISLTADLYWVITQIRQGLILLIFMACLPNR